MNLILCLSLSGDPATEGSTIAYLYFSISTVFVSPDCIAASKLLFVFRVCADKNTNICCFIRVCYIILGHCRHLTRTHIHTWKNGNEKIRGWLWQLFLLRLRLNGPTWYFTLPTHQGTFRGPWINCGALRSTIEVQPTAS